MSRAFPSCTRSIVAEIYLCHADFIVKKLRMETAGQGAGGAHAQRQAAQPPA
eukprot:COSAG01_NODE_65323_length_273_cov_1.488506_2_plen_51_part_01